MIKNALYRYSFFCIVALSLSSCFERYKFDPESYVRPIEIVKLSDNNYQHISYLKLKGSNYYPCNGYVYVSDGEAIIFDSPVNEESASQLIHFFQNELKVVVKGVVVNHAHIDASGGLAAFAKVGIPSYASIKTAQLLLKDTIQITHPFETKQEIKVGTATIENRYFGAAHTQDNIVSYIQEEKLLYGGCMVKSLQASQGNIKDADLVQWPQTIQKIKEAYPEVQTIIPGHGGRGDISLLSHTISLFSVPNENE